jgi:hypothetical protein
VVPQTLSGLDVRALLEVYVKKIDQEQQAAINERTKRADQTAATKAAMGGAKVAN